MVPPLRTWTGEGQSLARGRELLVCAGTLRGVRHPTERSMARIRFLLASTLCMAALGVSARAYAQSSGGAGGSGEIGGSAHAATRQVSEEHELTNLPKSVRVAPRAPTLPDLTHTAAEVAFEHTLASV